MPNLAGIWDPSAPLDDVERMLREQLRWIRIPSGNFSEYKHAEAGFAAAYLDNGIFENGPQPARAADSLVFLDGEISNRQELSKKYAGLFKGAEPTSPELCVALIDSRGPSVAKEFSGLFCIVHWDRRARRLTVISDRYGYRPLFYSQRNGKFIFGTELKAVSALMDRRDPDPVGSLEFFLYGAHFRDLTWLQHCSRLEPAVILTADAGGIRQERYWGYRYNEGPGPDQESCYTRFAVLMDRAVERAMRSRQHRVGIFLSGGYDSRAVAAAIRPEHLPIPALTFGAPQSRDMRFAAILAKRLGLDHSAVKDGETYLYGNCHRIIWRTEGLVLFSHTTSIRHHESIKDKMDIILTGFLGEFSGSHIWPGLMMARGREGARSAIHERMTGSRLPALRRIFRPAFLEATLPVLRERFDQAFDSLRNEHPMDLADAFNLGFVQPRSTGQASSVDRHVLEMRAPHMDSDLVDFLLTIPAKSRTEQKVYKKMIAYAFPAIRDVPCTNSGKPIDPVFMREFAKMGLSYLGRKAMAPVWAALGKRGGMARETRDLATSFRSERELKDKILEPLLGDGVFPESIFDAAGIESMIAEHYDGKANHEDGLGRLISWGLAYRFFGNRDLREAPPDLFADAPA